MLTQPAAARITRGGDEPAAGVPGRLVTMSAIGGTAYLRLIALGAAVGVPAALVAAGFLALVHELEHWLWDELPDQLGYSSPPWFLVLGLPLLGACVVVAARRLLPGDGGHEPLGGISVEPTPFRHGPGVALAAIGTLAFGGCSAPRRR